MPTHFSDLLFLSADRAPQRVALRTKKQDIRYQELAEQVRAAAASFAGLKLTKTARVAVWLPKTPHAVISFFAAPAAGLSFVPINPVLKAPQAAHILSDSGASVLVTQKARWQALQNEGITFPNLQSVILIDSQEGDGWDAFLGGKSGTPQHAIDNDLAAILYTSGSTGRPKGVCLSHRNLIAGAKSVSSYLENTTEDRLLAALPFSFDYGLSQLTTAFLVGASVTLIDYLLPRDLIRAIQRDAITGLAGVPPLWTQLAELDWPDANELNLRYMTNSGGKLPRPVLDALRQKGGEAQFYLMYGLTEAFRSTYLPPAELDARPDSMGKAIPNAEILVVREDGTPCDAGEPGELVHRGAHVALGYWNDPARTAERFKPAPGQNSALVQPEIAVWSGDNVQADEEGYLYFVGRDDEMIKTSGYRVSPTEVEEVLYAADGVQDAAVFGVPDDRLGQRIVAVVSPKQDDEGIVNLSKQCRAKLPGFMVPAEFQSRDTLPKNPNGKLDRSRLAKELINDPQIP